MFLNKEKVIKDYVFYERIRTLLFSSKLKQKKIYLFVVRNPKVIQKENEIVFGVIEGIICGTSKEELWGGDETIDYLFGGRFSFKEEPNKYYNMEWIWAMSWYELTDNNARTSGEWNILTRNNGLGGYHSSRYYDILTMVDRMDINSNNDDGF